MKLPVVGGLAIPRFKCLRIAAKHLVNDMMKSIRKFRRVLLSSKGVCSNPLEATLLLLRGLILKLLSVKRHRQKIDGLIVFIRTQ